MKHLRIYIILVFVTLSIQTNLQFTTEQSNELGLYFVNAYIGTPPQNVKLLIDTGSIDLWVHN